jgi:hypothetical protein
MKISIFPILIFFVSFLSLLAPASAYYDASQGRFIERDPIEYEGGDNLYNYVRNNPENKFDPFGFIIGSPSYPAGPDYPKYPMGPQDVLNLVNIINLLGKCHGNQCPVNILSKPRERGTEPIVYPGTNGIPPEGHVFPTDMADLLTQIMTQFLTDMDIIKSCSGSAKPCVSSLFIGGHYVSQPFPGAVPSGNQQIGPPPFNQGGWCSQDVITSLNAAVIGAMLRPLMCKPCIIILGGCNIGNSNSNIDTILRIATGCNVVAAGGFGLNPFIIKDQIAGHTWEFKETDNKVIEKKGVQYSKDRCTPTCKDFYEAHPVRPAPGWGNSQNDTWWWTPGNMW